MVALALPLVVEVAGEISPGVAGGFLFLRVVKSGFVVELPGFPVVEKRECHNREFCLQRYDFFVRVQCCNYFYPSLRNHFASSAQIVKWLSLSKKH